MQNGSFDPNMGLLTKAINDLKGVVMASKFGLQPYIKEQNAHIKQLPENNKLSTIVSCSRIIWITNSGDHRRKLGSKLKYLNINQLLMS